MTQGTDPPDPHQQPPGHRPPGQGYGQPGGHPPHRRAGAGLDENVAAGLSYVGPPPFGLVTGLIFFLSDRRPEVRFHAMQSVAFSVVTLVAYVVLVALADLASGLGILIVLLWLVAVIVWIVLLVQGFSGRHFKLPVLGDFSEQQVSKQP